MAMTIDSNLGEATTDGGITLEARAERRLIRPVPSFRHMVYDAVSYSALRAAQRSLQPLALQVQLTQKRLVGRDVRPARIPQDWRRHDDRARLIELGRRRGFLGLR